MAVKKTGRGLDPRERLRLGIIAVLVLAAIVYLIPKATAPSASAPAPTASVSPDAASAPQSGRTAREAAYDKDVAALERLIASDSADAATRAQAGERLARMISDHQCELGIEAALISAGFDPCLALMQNGSLTVMLNGSELSAAQSAAILSVCAAHSDVAVENIRIMAAGDM